MKKLKKILFTFAFLIISIFLFSSRVSAKKVNVYMFYGKTCPHCEEALKYLNSVKDKYDLDIHKYEVWYDEDNQKLMKKMGNFLDTNVTGVPFAIIDNTPIIGYQKGNTDETYRYHIKLAAKDDFVDKVGVELGVVDKLELKKTTTTINKKSKNINVSLPVIGKVNIKKMSLGLASIVLGLVDGFNPCAMWILLFLISTLIGMKDKKRLWILGITFLLTSSLVYLMFMLSWLQFAKMISGVMIVRTIIALVAVVGGCLNLKSYADSLGSDDGCNVVDAKKRKKFFAKIKKFTHEKSFVLALLGVIALAASVNLVELACSAGIPVIFTELLAINNIGSLARILYILIYILFFMLDDLIIFIVAVKTFELGGISTKYSKYSHLIGGILMLIIGILLIVKPEWLMFNF